MEPLLLEPRIQNYAWGTKGADAFIPKLLGLEPEADTPYAELWVGAHPKAPSGLTFEGESMALDQLLTARAGVVLGADVVRRFAGLPFLFKVLSINEALSIQAHPNLQQAAELHKRSPEHYPDANHKPELAIALDQLTALVGFRSYDEIASQLSVYTPLQKLAAEAARPFQLQSPDDIGERRLHLRELYCRIMAHENESPLLKEVIDELLVMLPHSQEDSRLDEVFLKCFRRYGYDIGLISILLLNLVELDAGEGVFLEAGTPHAYLEGNIVEVMANSDNVVRAGLTPKFKDVATLTEMLTYEMGPCKILGGREPQPEITYPIPTDEFAVHRLQMAVGDSYSFRGQGRVSLIFVVEGCLQDQDGFKLAAGQALLIPAASSIQSFGCTEPALVFYIRVPHARSNDK